MLFLDYRRGKRFIFLSVVLLTMAGSAIPCAAQSYEEIVLADEPFAYWRLDESEGVTNLTNRGTETVPDAVFAGDTSGGDLTLGVPGLADANNAAVRFEAFEGSVQIPDSSFMNTGGPWDGKTIELWFSADEADVFDEQVLFEQGGTTRGLNIYVRENQVFVGAWNAADDDGAATSPWPGGTDLSDPANALFLSTPIESNTAYHVALVVDGDPNPGGFSGTMTGYLNGEAFGEATGVGRIFAATDDSSIGATTAQTFFDTGNNAGAFTNNFLGVIDEVALYNRALSSDRIAIHFGIEFPPGDFNQDGNVDMADFQQLVNNYATGTTFAEGDNNFDGQVNLEDFAGFVSAFNAQGQAAAAAVPEPSSAMLVTFGALLFIAGRRGTRRTK